MNCAICGIRKPKRYCPGIHADICTICCATEREQSITCPLECEYLHQAHSHEHVDPVDPDELPHHDLEVTEDFVEENKIPLIYLAVALFDGAMKSEGVTDYDIREALESLVATWRALGTGLYYDAIPVNPFAAAIYHTVRERVDEFRKRGSDAEFGEDFRLPDSAILRLLVFLQRLEFTVNNRRKRSRAFLDDLKQFYPSELANTPEPDAPRIIL